MKVLVTLTAIGVGSVVVMLLLVEAVSLSDLRDFYTAPIDGSGLPNMRPRVA